MRILKKIILPTLGAWCAIIVFDVKVNIIGYDTDFDINACNFYEKYSKKHNFDDYYPYHMNNLIQYTFSA